MWIVGWCTVCLFVLYQPFMRLWVGERLTSSFLTMVLFCIYFYINRLSEVRALYSEAAGLWWKFRYVTIAEMIANFLLNIILGYFFQMNGILIATIITATLSSYIFITIITFKEYFQNKPFLYYLSNSFYMLVVFFVAVITYYICNNIISIINIENAYIGLIIRLFICIVVPNTLFLLIYYSLPRFRGYINSVIKRNRKDKLSGKKQ